MTTPADDDWADDLGPVYIMEEPEDMLRLLSSFTRPLSPRDRRERERIYRESGQLTREVLARALYGEFDA